VSARRLTVVQALPRLESGGVERGTVEVVEELAQRGHRAIVVSAGGPMVEEITRAGGEHVTMGVAKKSPFTLARAHKLRRLLRETHADVLHARSRVPAWVCLFALRGMDDATRPRFVTTVHGLNSVSRYSEVMTRGDLVIAVSESAERHVTRNYPRLDPSRVRVIRRGVEQIQKFRWERSAGLLSDLLKEAVELNASNKDLTLDNFAQGRLLLLPGEESVRERNYLVDAEVARLFFYTEHYYPALQQELQEDMRAMRQILLDMGRVPPPDANLERLFEQRGPPGPPASPKAGN